ncbi:MAG: hypothetical protein QW035_01585 [Candidatus Anstonellales archaeon]
MARPFFIILATLVLFQIAFADCAEDAYVQACSSCPFDESGKMDPSCYNAKRSAGTACVSTKYPIMAAKYAAGECHALDLCISELQSCVNKESTGNDRVDCQEGGTRMCYSIADRCAMQAAMKCGEAESICPGSSGLIVLAALGALAFALASKK